MLLYKLLDLTSYEMRWRKLAPPWGDIVLISVTARGDIYVLKFTHDKFWIFVIFFSEKKRRQLKKLEIWIGGQKAVSEGVGVNLNARGGSYFFLLEGVAPP